MINFGDDSVNSKSKTLDLDITNLTVQIFSPVPETSSWAMLATGLAGIGLRLGRRRRGPGPR